jgi:pimeloyl-ACP methyl ester carboxylesterase
MDWKMETIEVDGIALRLRRLGSGEPVLYLHGADGIGDSQPFLDALARDYEVFAPDHPGFGATPCPDWMDDISDLAYFYLDVLAKLDLRNVRVIGHSLGGWIAMEAAIRDASRMRDLTLIASAGIHVKGHAKADIFMIDPDEQARMSYADPALGEAAAQRAAADKYADEAIANRIAAARFCWNPRFFNPRLSRWLRRIELPTLIIWGEEDRIFPPEHGPALRDLIAGAQLRMAPGCGHLPHIEAVDETLTLIRSFYKG